MPEQEEIWCFIRKADKKPLVAIMPFEEWMVWAAVENMPEYIYFFAKASDVPEGVRA